MRSTIELKEVRREMQESADTTVTAVSSTSSEARTQWQSETTRVQSAPPATGEPPSSPSTGASSAEFIVSEIKQHKTATAIGALVILLVVVAVAFGIRSYLHAGSTEVAVESIAVIPFVNQNKDAGAEWISDGITESIINNLTQLPNLRVIARSSVFRYKGRETDPLAVGKELGVRAVLTGRLMQRGETMLISTELIDIHDNKQLWGEQYERPLADMLSVQRQIALMNRIYADILVDARRFDEAIAQYQKTIDLDPNFSTAHFFLGRAYEGNGMYDQAVEAYTRASAISPASQGSLTELKDIYKKSGWKAYIKANIDRMVIQPERVTLPPYVVATFYARLGQSDETLKWLEKGYEERDFRLIMITVSFEFDSIRSDPRFKDLVRRMGLPE